MSLLQHWSRGSSGFLRNSGTIQNRIRFYISLTNESSFVCLIGELRHHGHILRIMK